MSTTTQFTTFADLYTGLLNRVREDTSISGTIVKAKQFIGTAHADIYINSGEKFPWAESRATLTTHPAYSTGTVSVTKGSTTVTGTSTLWTTQNDLSQDNVRVGGKITLSGSLEVYEVASVAGPGSLELATAYIGETDSATTYQYFEDEYALAEDFAKPIDVRSFDDGHRITLKGRQDFRRMHPRNRIPAGRIHHAVILDLPFDGDTTPIRKVQFAPPPSDYEIIPYTYVTKHIVVTAAGVKQEDFSGDTDEPIMPKRFRHLILLHALYNWYRDLKDDTRANEVKQEFVTLIGRVVGDQEIGSQRARFKADTRRYRRNARYPYDRGRQRYDLHGRFDRFEDC